MSALWKLIIVMSFIGLAPPASAHSFKELESSLSGREPYFQPIDKAAPSFSLQDAAGRSVSLADFHGKVVVLHFIYTSCPDECPLHAERIAEIQSMINVTPMKSLVQFITITTDPAKDRGKVLTGYGNAHGLDPVNWMFLTTKPGQPEDATRRLAQRFGHRFDKTNDGYQMHGIVTHVIDKEGRWRANFHGLKFEPSNLVIFVNALVNDFDKHPHPEPSFWDRMKSWF